MRRLMSMLEIFITYSFVICSIPSGTVLMLVQYKAQLDAWRTLKDADGRFKKAASWPTPVMESPTAGAPVAEDDVGTANGSMVADPEQINDKVD